MRRLKIIASAYACEPHKGSEPGIGWNIVREIARHHEVWVITRANNRPCIEAELKQNPEPGLHPVYFDLPPWARRWKRRAAGLQLYYYLWQIGAYRIARLLHHAEAFDLAHHVTFGRYWNPSFLALLPVPFVWGPVGGGESTPPGFLRAFGVRGLAWETLRLMARRLGELDPFVRLTARRTALALATTEETATRLRSMKTNKVLCLGNAALNQEDVRHLSALGRPPARPFRFISIGRLLHWKGFELGIRAFAHAGIPDAEYWIIGDGPERNRLQLLAKKLGVASRVQFLGALTREQTLAQFADCHALVHPSLHDSGGWVCIEAMAAGRPVLCLDLGGPARLVTCNTGFRIPARSPLESITGLAVSMRTVAVNRSLYSSMGTRAAEWAASMFTWEARAGEIREAYTQLPLPAQPVPAPGPLAVSLNHATVAAK